MNTKVIICDDHPAIREGINMMLVNSGINVQGTCDSVAKLSELINEHPNSVVVSDLAIDNFTIRNLIDSLKEISPGCQIVIFSMRDSLPTIKACYDAGAMGFVSKGHNFDELVKAIINVAEGKKYYHKEILEMLNTQPENSTAPEKILTEKELEVLILYAKRKSVEDIAGLLSVSTGYIQNVLKRVCDKLSLNRIDLPEYAKNTDLIS